MNVTFQWVAPDAIRNVWETIKPGLVKVARKAPGGWIPEDVYHELVSGQSALHLGILEDRYCGFIVTKVLEGVRGKTLLIWVLYSDGNAMLDDNMEQVREWGRVIGAKRIQFQSPRKGWGRAAEKLGFEQTQVIYESEL